MPYFISKWKQIFVYIRYWKILKLLTISTQNNMFIKFYNMNTIFYIKIFINADV